MTRAQKRKKWGLCRRVSLIKRRQIITYTLIELEMLILTCPDPERSFTYVSLERLLKDNNQAGIGMN